MNRKFMEEAARLASESVEKGWGGPFGAVIVKDGEIIGRGQNRVLLPDAPCITPKSRRSSTRQRG
jgi:guanine deaminase